MRTLIIGQAPGRSGDGEPLSGRIGKRLASLCGMTLEEYLAYFDRTNLLDYWPGAAARGDLFMSLRDSKLRAQAMRPKVEGRVVVLLGFNVSAAFEVKHRPLFFEPHWGGIFGVCPHPSGINMWWNQRQNVEHARLFWRQVVRRQ
jgi:uracil-DNA glycosylase